MPSAIQRATNDKPFHLKSGFYNLTLFSETGNTATAFTVQQCASSEIVIQDGTVLETGDEVESNEGPTQTVQWNDSPSSSGDNARVHGEGWVERGGKFIRPPVGTYLAVQRASD